MSTKSVGMSKIIRNMHNPAPKKVERYRFVCCQTEERARTCSWYCVSCGSFSDILVSICIEKSIFLTTLHCFMTELLFLTIL